MIIQQRTFPLFLVGLLPLAGTAALLLVAASRTAAAPQGGYLDFTGPGPGYMEVTHDPLLGPSQAVTVEAWVYLRSYLGGYGSQSDCPVIAGKGWTETYMLGLACGGDFVEGYINGQQVFAEQERLPLDEWVHLALTYDGSTARTFVNGEISAAVDVPGPLGQNNSPLRVGSDVLYDRTPDARIDDVRIWSVARTASQIRDAMNIVSTSSPGLVARWTFTDGSLEDIVGDRPGMLVGHVVSVPEEPSITPTPTDRPSETPVPTPSGTPVPVGAKGDVDCNQRIDMADVTGLLRDIAVTRDAPAECAQPVTPTPTPCPTVSPTNCDVPPAPTPTPDGVLPARLNLDCDEVVDAHDSLALLLHVAELNPGLPEDCAPIGGSEPSATPAASETATPTPTATPAASSAGTATVTAGPLPDTGTPSIPP